MTPSRPYLIRTLYEWIVDNRLTPYLVIADQPEAIIPHEHVQEGKIVLNISPEVIHGLAMGNDAVEFKARFSGVPRQIYAPMRTILAIYAKENGRGMVFQEEDMGDGDDSPPPVAASAPVRAKPNLKIIK